jgi:hypothetical protein
MHLTPPLVFPWVRVSLIFIVLWIVPFNWAGRWIWLRISSVYLIWRTDFDCRFLRLPNLDTLILTNGFCVWNCSRRVWLVNRECLPLQGTWSHLRCVRGSVLAFFFYFILLVIPTCIFERCLGHFIEISTEVLGASQLPLVPNGCLFIVEGFIPGQTDNITITAVSSVSRLDCNVHKEGNTQVFAHAAYSVSKQGCNRVVIRTNDTNSIIMVIYHSNLLSRKCGTRNAWPQEQIQIYLRDSILFHL